MLALFLAAAASAAQPASVIPVRTIGHWDIVRDNTMCFATSGFGTNYSLMVGVDRSLRTSLAVSSDLWKWPNGTKLNALQALGGKTFSGGVTEVVVDGGARSMITGMAPEFLTVWRTAKSLDVFEDANDYDLGDEALVSLKFEDNGPIVDALIACSKQLTGTVPVAPPASHPAPPASSAATNPLLSEPGGRDPLRRLSQDGAESSCCGYNLLPRVRFGHRHADPLCRDDQQRFAGAGCQDLRTDHGAGEVFASPRYPGTGG